MFPAGPRPERSVAENTGPGVNFGEPVEASDADGDELSYTLGGADAASFEIDAFSGQLRTSDAPGLRGQVELPSEGDRDRHVGQGRQHRRDDTAHQRG